MATWLRSEVMLHTEKYVCMWLPVSSNFTDDKVHRVVMEEVHTKNRAHIIMLDVGSFCVIVLKTWANLIVFIPQSLYINLSVRHPVRMYCTRHCCRCGTIDNKKGKCRPDRFCNPSGFTCGKRNKCRDHFSRAKKKSR